MHCVISAFFTEDQIAALRAKAFKAGTTAGPSNSEMSLLIATVEDGERVRSWNFFLSVFLLCARQNRP